MTALLVRCCFRLVGLASFTLPLFAVLGSAGRGWITLPAAASTERPSTATCLQNPVDPSIEDPPMGALLVELATDRASYGKGEPVTLLFTVSNTSTKPVTVSFSIPEPPDLRLSISSAADGHAVWNSPTGLVAAGLSQCTFAPGESNEFIQIWDQQAQNAAGAPAGQVPGGAYALSGRLAILCGTHSCVPPDLPVPVAFAIEDVARAAPPPATLVNLCSAGRIISGTYYGYQAGWNLVGGPEGRVLVGNTALYRYNPGGMTYQPLPLDKPLELGLGYWAFFPTPISGPTPPGTSRTLTVPLPARRYVLIGNPRPSLVSVQGADVVYTYDPLAGNGGYTKAAVLRPGQGAWAYSARGGTLTIADPSRCTYPNGLLATSRSLASRT